VRTVSRRVLWPALVASAVALLIGGSVSCSRSGSGESAEPAVPAEFSGYQRTPVRDVSTATIPTVDPVADPGFVAAPGGLRLVYFGFTYCPDVCPTTLSDLRRALGELGPEDRARVDVDVVTVDPARDSAQVLADYVQAFVPDATSHRTDDDAALRAVVTAFGGDYSVTTGDDGEPEVSHTAEVYAVDDTGRIVLAWPFGTPAGSISVDLRRLLAGERPSPGTGSDGPSTTQTTNPGGTT
jgi:protein SCO1/2